VGQHQRHRRSRRSDHHQRQPAHDRRAAGQLRRRRLLPGARCRSGLGACRRAAQSALPQHGQPLRLGVLDLPAAGAGRGANGRRRSCATAADDCRRRRRGGFCRRLPGGDPDAFRIDVARRAAELAMPLPTSPSGCRPSARSVLPTRRRSRWRAIARPNSPNCSATSTASIRAITSPAFISCTRRRTRGRRAIWRFIAISAGACRHDRQVETVADGAGRRRRTALAGSLAADARRRLRSVHRVRAPSRRSGSWKPSGCRSSSATSACRK
jgi:hypothetical protein